MTVAELRKLLDELPDDTLIAIYDEGHLSIDVDPEWAWVRVSGRLCERVAAEAPGGRRIFLIW